MADWDRWFQSEIAIGFAELLSLSLPDRPAHDVIQTSIKVWCQSLWGAREWVQDRDTSRIRTAFVRLARTSERWPTPAQFLREVPPLEAPKAIARELDFEAAEVQLARLFAAMRERGTPIDDGGLEKLQARLSGRGIKP